MESQRGDLGQSELERKTKQRVVANVRLEVARCRDELFETDPTDQTLSVLLKVSVWTCLMIRFARLWC